MAATSDGPRPGGSGAVGFVVDHPDGRLQRQCHRHLVLLGRAWLHLSPPWSASAAAWPGNDVGPTTDPDRRRQSSSSAPRPVRPPGSSRPRAPGCRQWLAPVVVGLGLIVVVGALAGNDVPNPSRRAIDGRGGRSPARSLPPCCSFRRWRRCPSSPTTWARSTRRSSRRP